MAKPTAPASIAPTSPPHRDLILRTLERVEGMSLDALQEKLALIQGLPRIIEQAVKPMQNIDSIRIMQVDGLNTGAAGAQAGDGTAPAGSGNLAEQAVGAALKYRAYAPVVDQLISGRKPDIDAAELSLQRYA